MVRKYIDVSTAHIKQSTMQNIIRIGIQTGAFYAYTYPEGAFLSLVEPDEEDNLSVEVNEDLIQLIAYAREQGAELIRLDADAPISNELPEYEW